MLKDWSRIVVGLVYFKDLVDSEDGFIRLKVFVYRWYVKRKELEGQRDCLDVKYCWLWCFVLIGESGNREGKKKKKKELQGVKQCIRERVFVSIWCVFKIWFFDIWFVY